MESEQFGSFQQCYHAYKACRRDKRKSAGVLQFERKLLDELTTLSERLPMISAARCGSTLPALPQGVGM